MIRPMIRPMVRPMIRSVIESGVIQRYFARQDPVQQGYYLFQNPVVESGDLDWSFDFSTATTSTQVLAGNSSGTTFIQLRALGTQIRYRTNGVSSTFTVPQYADSTLRTCRFIVTGTSVELILVGISYGSLTCGVGAELDVIGSLVTTNFLSGIIANVDLGNGNKWAMNKDGATTTEQAENGSNLLTRVNVSAGDVELFTLNTDTDPDQWESPDKTIIIPVAP